MKNKQIKGGVIISYIGIIINIVSGLLYTPWILHTIGESDYGLYILAMSLISMFVMDFGISATVTRYASVYLAKGEKEKADSIVGLAYKFFLAIDVIIAVTLIVVYLSIHTIYRELTPLELEKFKVVYAIVAIYNVIQFPFINLSGILTAYEKFIQLKISDLINKLFVVFVTIIVLTSGGGLYELVAINAIGGLLKIVFQFVMVRRYTDCTPSYKKNNEIKMREIVGFSAWSTMISLSNRCIFLLMPTVLGAVSGTASITVFGFASALESYVFLLANALNGLFMPHIARLSVHEDKEKNILALMIKVGRIQIHIIGLLIIGFIIVGDLFINDVWLGAGYEDLYLNTLLLILPSYINLPQQIANTYVTVANKVKNQAIVFIFMALINIGLSIPFSMKCGATGACLSIFIAYMFRNVVMNILYKRQLHIDIREFFKKSFFEIAPYQLVVMVIGLLLKHFIPFTNGKIAFVVLGLSVTVVYICIMYNLVMTEEEKHLIMSRIKR